MATKKITVKAPSRALAHKAGKALEKGNSLGARVDAEVGIAKKKSAPKKKK